MTNNCEFKELSIDYQEEVGFCQQAVECNIDTSTKGGVSKLLSVCADATVNMCERMGDESVKISGVINYKVICLNLESVLESYDYMCDFDAMVKVDDATEYTAFFAKACVLDIDSGINGDTIRLQTICDIKLYGSRCEEFKALVSVQGDMISNSKDIGIQNISGSVDSAFMVIEEYETGVNVEKILLFDSDIISCNAVAQDGLIILSGEITATVVYESMGAINTKNFNIPYSEELTSKSTPMSRADLTASISASKIILSGVEDNNVIRLEMNCRARGVIYESSEMTIVDDVYSLTHELEIEREEVEYYNYIGEHCFKEKIAGCAELDANTVGIRKVLSACLSRNCLTNVFASDKMITVEGIMACSVIYEDTNMEIGSIQVELPYSLPFVCESVKDDDMLLATSIIEILSAKVKRDKEIEVTALITVQTKIKREVEFCVIEEVKIGECKKSECYKAITIYQTKREENLWSICKELGATAEMITAQNPSLESGVAQGQKVMFYRQLTK